MYRAPTDEEQARRDYRFGDIFEAPWIFDLVLRWDSRPVTLQPLPGRPNERAYFPQDVSTIKSRRDFPKDTIVAHADIVNLAIGHGNGTLAVVVSDTCDIDEAVNVRVGKGRLTFAALTKLPPGGDERDTALNTTAFDRYPLRPQPELEFEGGVIEFQQGFSIMAKDLLEAATRVLTIDEEEIRQNLHYRWSAHTTRHGPVAAADGALKLAKLLTANGDPERARTLRFDPGTSLEPLARDVIEPLRSVLLLPWLLEGPVFDRIAADLESGRPYGPTVNDALDLLRRLGPAAERAIAAIERAASFHESQPE